MRESGGPHDAWAASRAKRGTLPGEEWKIQVVCTGDGSHRPFPLATYHHDASPEPRVVDNDLLQSGKFLKSWLDLRGRQDAGAVRRMRQSVPYWEKLADGDPLIPPGPWGASAEWGWGQFGRESHSYHFFCSRCPDTGTGARNLGRPRETRIDSYRFIDVYVREVGSAGGHRLDVSHLPEWGRAVLSTPDQ